MSLQPYVLTYVHFMIPMVYSHCTGTGLGPEQGMGLEQWETMDFGPCPCLGPV